MKIKEIKLYNFRIYKGENIVNLSSNTDKNISIIAGKNGYGKTTFLTALIWCFYGKLMGQVEEKYRKDIKNLGGYEQYLNAILNRSIDTRTEDPIFYAEVQLIDLFIPSIPCRTVTIKRTYNLNTREEQLSILIDGDENELTKEVGFEVFINDFILPREIAKFFFFDAEKIVSLAEAKSRNELRSLSKAYSEVLGIKKYEELKKNLESLQIKLRRRGVSGNEQSKLEDLVLIIEELEKRIEHNIDKQDDIDKTVSILKSKSDNLQEKLIREGNAITLVELKELKFRSEELKKESIKIKSNMKDLMDLAPFVIAGSQFKKFRLQLTQEHKTINNKLDHQLLINELESFSKEIQEKAKSLNLMMDSKEKLDQLISISLKDRIGLDVDSSNDEKIYLDFSEEQIRKVEAIYDNIRTTYLSSFKSIVHDEKINRALFARNLNKIKQAEARKDNPLAKQFREEKVEADNKITELNDEKEQLIEELGGLKSQFNSNKKVLSELEKNFKMIESDKRKYGVTSKVLLKINELIIRIKEDKKYSLQKSISLGLKKLMHKEEFIANVRVNILDDVMDIDLLDQDGGIIDKDSLSKGEQQLYATALLKALVDESGIKFPVFIDSPLQKFDKFHSKNIIKEFYPAISDQVVLFPLLEKELSEVEYELLKPNLNKAYLINNNLNNSQVLETQIDDLFKEFKKEKDVYAY